MSIAGASYTDFMEKYGNFEELKNEEIEGRDFQINFRKGYTGIAILAPHGGGIEPGTSEIADKVAGEDHCFYSFEGWKRKGNFELHITSRHFDEPIANRVTTTAKTAVAIHGCNGDEKVVFIGGRNLDLKNKIQKALEEAHFPVMESPKFPGTNPLNICNRNRSGKGVQLEISAPLRCTMFENLTRPERKTTTKSFTDFVEALRKGLTDF